MKAREAIAAIEELAGISIAIDSINPPMAKKPPQIADPMIIPFKLFA